MQDEGRSYLCGRLDVEHSRFGLDFMCLFVFPKMHFEADQVHYPHLKEYFFHLLSLITGVTCAHPSCLRGRLSKRSCLFGYNFPDP